MRKVKLGEVLSLGQGQAAVKWQSWILSKLCLHLKPCALNHSSFSEFAHLPLNCCLFKLHLNCLWWRVHHFCFSAFVLTAINEEKLVFTKAKPNKSISAFQWADWELACSLINPHAHSVFKRRTMLQNNTSPETGCWQ